MPSFGVLKKQLLELGAQDTGGEAEDMAGVALNNSYRRVLSLVDEELSKRKFIINTVAGVAATVTGTGTETFAVTANSNDTLQISVDGGPSQAVTLTAGTAQTVIQVVADINSALNEVTASVTGTSVKLTTAQKSVESRIEIEAVANDAYSLLGFSVGITRGSGGPKYGLPLYARTDLNFDDPVNDRTITEITPKRFNRINAGSVETGDPTHYYDLGTFGVQKQPATASVITAVSDSSSDVTSFFVTIIGFDANGLQMRERLTLTGTTGVSTNATFETVERVVKTARTTTDVFSGNITVTDSGSNTLAVLPIWVESPQYVWVEFTPTPDTARKYTLFASAYKVDLLKDDDWPDVDDYFHNLILWWAGVEVLPSYGKDDQALLWKDMADERIKEYIKNINKDPNMVLTFADVQMGAGQHPNRPWVAGVDYGLAKGQ